MRSVGTRCLLPALACALASGACVERFGETPASTETEESGDGEPGDGEPGDGEPGDGEPGDGDPGDGEPGDGDPGEPGDGDGEPGSTSCLAATDADGTPGEVPVPRGCEVVCGQGWGHPDEPLEIEWTLEVGEEEYTRESVLVDPGGSLRVVGNRFGVGPIIRTIGVDGTVESVFEPTEPQTAIEGATIGADGTLYLARTSVNFLTLEATIFVWAYDADDQPLWVEDIGNGMTERLHPRPAPGFLTLALVRGNQSVLSAHASDAATAWTTPPVVHGSGISTSALGEIALSTPSAIQVFADDGALLHALPLAEGDTFSEVTWLDADTLVYATALGSLDPSDGYLAWVDLDGATFSRSYAHSERHCEDAPIQASDDDLSGVTRAADGSLYVAGTVAFGAPEWRYAALVLHVGADGELLGRDLGMWPSRGVQIVTGSDGAAYALLDGQAGPARLRKYAQEN